MMTKIDSEGKEKKKLSSTYGLLVIMKNGFHQSFFYIRAISSYINTKMHSTKVRKHQPM